MDVEEAKRILLTHDGKGIKSKTEALKVIQDSYWADGMIEAAGIVSKAPTDKFTSPESMRDVLWLEEKILVTMRGKIK